MKKRINHLRGKIDRHGGIDILVTHAPLHGYGDMTDLRTAASQRFRSCWTGIALARLLHRNGHDVTVWSKFPKEIENLSATRTHPALPGLVIPETVHFTCGRLSPFGRRRKARARSSRTDRLSWMLPRALSRTHS